jgi:gliotoxin/aspirochlorine/mycotoxins biosynthesis cytochrome P450 monooxygenase
MTVLDYWSVISLPLLSALAISCFLSRQRILSYVGQVVLSHLHAIRDTKGKSIQGPWWQWPNGQIVDKFLSAKQCSFQWQQFGDIYLIWAFNIPEM